MTQEPQFSETIRETCPKCGGEGRFVISGNYDLGKCDICNGIGWLETPTEEVTLDDLKDLS